MPSQYGLADCGKARFYELNTTTPHRTERREIGPAAGVKRTRALGGASGRKSGRMHQCAFTNMSRHGSEMRSLLDLRQLVMRSRSGMNFAQTVSTSIVHALRPACSSSALLAVDASARPNSTDATTAAMFIDYS